MILDFCLKELPRAESDFTRLKASEALLPLLHLSSDRATHLLENMISKVNALIP